ncbi:MAG TPA: hypothetical protein VHL57_08240, partial [Flavobacteriales bacterium]|nr:hypothetical protein [Flavobacteriales bacterium]
FRVVQCGPLRWFPSLGSYAEYAAADRLHDVPDTGTGGSVVYSHLGSRLWWRSFGLSLAWQHVVLQDKGAMMTPDRERFLAGLTYNLTS